MTSNSGWPLKAANGAVKERRNFAPSVFLCVSLLLGLIGQLGCARPEASSVTGKAVAAANSDKKDERYPLTGQVLRIEADRKILVVRHDEIKGYMPAMTMEFVVSAGDLSVAKPGQRIRAELVPAKDGGDFRLEKIWPDDKVSADTITASALQLRQDTHARGKSAYR